MKPRPSLINRARAYLAGLIAPAKASNFDSVRESYSRARVNHTAPADFRKEMTSTDRVELMRLLRSLEKSSGVVRAYVSEVATYAVGDTGIIPEIQSDDEEFRKAAEAIVEEANIAPTICGRFTLVETEHLICRAIDIDGDIFAVFTRDEMGNPKVQLLEGHRIGMGGAYSPSNSEPGWVDGIKFDSYGRPTAYRVIEDDGRTREIPASAVAHIYEPEHYSGARGVSPLVAAIPTLRDLKEILGAEKLAVKENSRVARTLTTQTGEFDENDAGILGTNASGQGTDPEDIDRRAGGVTIALSPGERLESYSSSRPSSAFTGFVDHLNRDSLVATGLPSDWLIDPNKMGGAVVRLVVARVERRIRLRQNAIEKFLRRWTAFIIADAISKGKLRAVEGWEKSFAFVYPRRISVDAGRESNANRSDIEFGLKRMSDDFAERGLNFRKEVRGRAQDFAEILRVSKETGVPLEFFFKPGFAWLFPAMAPSTKKGGDGQPASPAPGVEDGEPEDPSESEEGEDEEDDSVEPVDEEDDEVVETSQEAVALASIRAQAPDSKVVPVAAFIRANARRGLRYYEEGRAGDGLKRQTVNEARELAAGRASVEKLRRMSAWLKRHKGDLRAPKNRNPKDPGYPGAGLVAWLLWGGDADGSSRAAEWVDAKLARLDREGS